MGINSNKLLNKIQKAWLPDKLREAWRSDRIWKIEWLYVAATSGVAILTFFYMDLISLTIWSTNLLDVIWEGNLRGFYALSAENIHNVRHEMSGMDIFALIPHAIWNIPIWIAQRFFHIEIVESSYCLVWSKLFFVGLFACVCGVAYKISLLLHPEKNKAMTVCFLSASSIFVYTGIYYAGQNDIIFILLGLLSVYYLMRDRNKLFFILAGLSILAKPFFLFPFIALLLLTEKNVLKVVGQLVLAVSFVLPFKLLFWGAPLYRESLEQGPGPRMIKGFVEGTYPSGIGEFAPVLVCLGVLYLFAYLKTPRDGQERNSYILYVTAAAFLLIPLWTYVQFYRMIILAPVLSLVMVHTSRFYKLNVVLETVMGFSYTIVSAMGDFVYKVKDVRGLGHKLFGVLREQEYDGLSSYVKTNFESYVSCMPVFHAAFVFAALALLVINFPAFRLEGIPRMEKAERWILWVRLSVPLFFMVSVLVFYGG
ncbi:MAG: hypothetical protein FWG14_08695 [Peptococcaceae bacterium]|nr:hypothetical protein [Peptococcaceae bacterium]